MTRIELHSIPLEQREVLLGNVYEMIMEAQMRGGHDGILPALPSKAHGISRHFRWLAPPATLRDASGVKVHNTF